MPREQRNTYPYPLPLTEAFWQQYAEPVDDFIRAARDLVAAVTTLARLKEAGALSEVTHQDRTRALDALHGLIQAVQPVLRWTEDGTVHDAWAAPSLIAAFGMMVRQDLAQRRLARCQRCDRLFTSEAYQARYCSARCRQTVQKRRQRRRGTTRAGRAG